MSARKTAPRPISDLSPILLGPSFASLTPEQFADRVRSLKVEKKVALPKVPKIKAAPVVHKIVTQTKMCEICGKKPRKPDSKCSGKPTKNSTEILPLTGEAGSA